MLNSAAVNTVVVAGGGAPAAPAASVRLPRGGLNASSLNGSSLNAVASTSSAPAISAHVVRSLATLNGAGLNSTALAGGAELKAAPVPLKPKGTAALNGAGLNLKALAGGAAPKPATVSPLPVGTATLNGAGLNSRQLLGGTPAASPVAVLRYRRGAINSAGLNGSPLAGVVLQPAPETTQPGDEPTIVDTYTSRPHTLNGLGLNAAPLLGASITRTRELVYPGTGVAYSDTLEALASAVVTLEGYLTGTFTATANGSVEITGTAAILRTYESVAVASEELLQTLAASVSLEEAATVSEELSPSKRWDDTFESSATISDEQTYAYTGFSSVESGAVGSHVILLAGAQYNDEFEEASQGSVELELLRTSYDTLIEATGAAAEASGRKHSVSNLLNVGVGSVEITLFKVAQAIRDTLTATARGSADVQGTLAAYDAILSTISMDGGLQPSGSGEAWVFNTRTSAMSRYAALDVSQVVEVDGELAATGPDGLYAFDYTDTPEARAVFGASDGGNMQIKSARNVYLTVASKGGMRVLARAGAGNALNEVEYECTVDSHTVPAVYRVDLLRGERAHLWGFELRAPKGANAMLLGAAVLMQVDSRRV